MLKSTSLARLDPPPPRLDAPPSWPAVLDVLTAVVRAEPAVRRALLFGSRARGDARPRADIDLAVEAPGLSVAGWQRLLRQLHASPTLLQLDVLRLEEVGESLRAAILEEGMVLHERA